MRIRYFVSVCVLLAVAAICFGAADEKEYFAVFMDGGKVGHGIHTRTVADGKITTSEEVEITISRMNMPITVRTVETSIETPDGKPIGFESLQDMGLMAMKITGTLDGSGNVTLKTASMGSEQTSAMQWPEGALMSEGLRILSDKKGLAEGTSYTTKVFSPGLLQAVDAEIKVGAKRNIDLLGRVVALTEVTTVMKFPGAGEIVSTSFVDEKLNVQKSIIPVMGMNIEMVACAKEFALGDNDVVEVLERMLLPSPQTLENIGSAESAVYYLKPDANTTDLKIPLSDNQSVKAGGNGVAIVTVKPAAAPAGAKLPYRGNDPTALEALKPTRYIQSDDERIIELARRAIGETKDAAEAAKKIEAFAADYIEDKNLSVGYASAVEVVASRQGDCTEFAVLTAAMCRAVGIPARIATGVAYVQDYGAFKNIFGGHAWVEAYIGGKWVGLDAAFKSAGLGGFDAGHIALALGSGNPEDFLNLVNSVGRFKIEKAVVNNR